MEDRLQFKNCYAKDVNDWLDKTSIRTMLDWKNVEEEGDEANELSDNELVN